VKLIWGILVKADLIYLDPPFFSNKHYEVVWGDEAEVRSFKDRQAVELIFDERAKEDERLRQEK